MRTLGIAFHAPSRPIGRLTPSCVGRARFAALAIAGFLALGAGGDPVPGAASLTLESMTYLATRGDERDFLLSAARARYQPESDRIDLEEVSLEVAATPEIVGFEMQCARGELDLSANSFVATGRVRARTRDGRRIATEKLRYDQASGVVSSDVPVEIRDTAGLLRGGGFVYHVREGRFSLRGGATVVQEGAATEMQAP